MKGAKAKANETQLRAEVAGALSAVPAELDAAVAGAIASKFRNTGQTCVCTNRLLVQDGVYDRFAEKLGQAVQREAYEEAALLRDEIYKLEEREKPRPEAKKSEA